LEAEIIINQKIKKEIRGTGGTKKEGCHGWKYPTQISTHKLFVREPYFCVILQGVPSLLNFNYNYCNN